MVTYPKRPGGGSNRPGAGNNRPGNANNRPGLANNRPSGRPGSKNNRPGGNRNNIGNKGNLNNNRVNNVHINNVNVGRRNNGLNRPANLPANKRNWNSNKWGGNRGVWGNNNNININNNFRYGNNYAYRPNHWGARPWWGAGGCHSWHRGHWNYGWNSRYYNRHWYCSSGSFASGFVWGIAAWSFGNMIYDMGYNSYRNPYPAPPVTYNVYPESGGSSSKSSINYSEPVSVTAAATPPGDEAQTELAETKSDESLERSRTAFKQRDYMAAMKAVDEAIAYTPGDVTLHEYRALIFFALGRYADAAGVLNPVLASGPGWGWDTMIEFYDATATYDEQVAKLEAYVKGTPKAADARFALGYHYLVQGYMDKSYAQFEQVVKLQPNDSIARQLRDLAKSSLPDDENAPEPAPLPEAERPAPVPTEKLVGTWVSDRGDAGKITFKMKEDGKFTWSYTAGDNSSELKGTYGIDDEGLLVLSMDEDDAQMVSVVDMKNDNDMHFTIVGSPDGDPGLDFTK